MKKRVKRLLVLGLSCMLLTGNVSTVFAEETNNNPDVLQSAELPNETKDVNAAAVTPVLVTSDGTTDAVFSFDKGSGETEIVEITEIYFEAVNEVSQNELQQFWCVPNNAKKSKVRAYYDLEKGEVVLTGEYIRWISQRGIDNATLSKEGYTVTIACRRANGEMDYLASKWEFCYQEPAKMQGMPSLKNGYCETNGSQDIVFQFTNGVGDYAIKEIKNFEIWVSERSNQPTDKDYLQSWHVEDTTSFEYDLNKGTYTWKKHAISPLWTSGYQVIGNTYVGSMRCVLANGETKIIHSDADNAWKIKVVDQVAEETGPHVENLPAESQQLSNAEMQNLVNVNRDKDVIIQVPTTNGVVVYAFAKGSMQMVENKEVYDLGVNFISDVKKLGMQKLPFEESEFVFRANFNYDGKLPADAKITFPVGKKWAGQTVYYYQIFDDGTLSYTGQKAVVTAEGECTISQGHCSNYVGLLKAPETKQDKPNLVAPKTADTSSFYTWLMLAMAVAVFLMVKVMNHWRVTGRK